MSVRIRLRRVGRKKQPYYRLVVADRRSPRDGAYIENVGFYDPRRQPAELQVDLAKVDAWLARGAELSESAASLVRKARRGGDSKVALVTAEQAVERRRAEAAAVRAAPVVEKPAPVPEAAAAPESEAAAETVGAEAAAEVEAAVAPAAEAAEEAPAAEESGEATEESAEEPQG